MKKTIKLGNHRGNPRLWLEGKWLHNHGFRVGGSFEVGYLKGRVVLQVCSPTAERATNKVSGRSADIAIIDINSSELRESLGNAERVSVTLGTWPLANLTIRPA